MLDLYLEGRFKKDLKLAKKRHLPLEKLWGIVEQLQTGKALAAKHRPHKLKANGTISMNAISTRTGC
jgi:mRNA interferase YafQ